MIVSAFTTDDPRVALSHAIPDNERTTLTGMFCTADVNISEAFISFHDKQDKERPCRPYMHMIGECVGLRGDLPYDVRGLQFPEGKGIPVDIFYEFDDEQIVDLVRKGLYTPTFKCPSVLYESTIYMPVYCDMVMIPPVREDVAPIVFADIQYRTSIEVDVTECGYDFAQFFEKAVPEQVEGFGYMDSFDMSHRFAFGADEPVFEDEVEEKRELSIEEQKLLDEYGIIHEKVVKEHVEPQQKYVEEARERVANGIVPEHENDTKDKLVLTDEDKTLIKEAMSIEDDDHEELDFEDAIGAGRDEMKSEVKFIEGDSVENECVDDDFVEETLDESLFVDSRDEESLEDVNVRRAIHHNATESNEEANFELYDADGDGVIDEHDLEIIESKASGRRFKTRSVPVHLQDVVEAEHQRQLEESQSKEDYSD